MYEQYYLTKRTNHNKRNKDFEPDEIHRTTEKYPVKISVLSKIKSLDESTAIVKSVLKLSGFLLISTRKITPNLGDILTSKLDEQLVIDSIEPIKESSTLGQMSLFRFTARG